MAIEGGFDRRVASRWMDGARGGAGVELVAVERLSVDPGDGHPLGGGGHQVHGLLQQADGVVDLVVDDGLVKVVGVGALQQLRLLLQPLQGVVLGGGLKGWF